MTVMSLRPELVVAGDDSPAPARPLLSVVLPALTAGHSLTSTLPAWQKSISDEARADGYTVVNK